jgi:SAM-dependent methyltransferase
MKQRKRINQVKNFEYSPDLYDLQVNWPQRLAKEKDFFSGIIKKHNVKNVLDIGCGTGHHSQMLSGLVEGITAIDPSEESIEYAKNQVVTSKNIRLHVAGFENMETRISGHFDLIICLGNTLAILGNRRKVKAALKATRKKLVRGGLAIFQFLNFEPEIMEKNRFYRPRVFFKDNKKYIFMKHFEYGKIKTLVDFIIIQMDAEDNIEEFYDNSSMLCTLRKNLFLKMADNSGYKKIELIGADGKEEFDKKKHISLYALLYN